MDRVQPFVRRVIASILSFIFLLLIVSAAAISSLCSARSPHSVAEKPDRDIADYAQRQGLETETLEVETADGFLLDLCHVFLPGDRSLKPPVLLVHGLLQSVGTFCVNREDSLAFFLAHNGFDVWLGNNRGGFVPRHQYLQPSDPRVWQWTLREMALQDLPTLVARVLDETGCAKLALICHSQGTSQAFLALAQSPTLGASISVFCALAPTVFPGPLLEKLHFRFLQRLSPRMFRLIFGVHSFIPLMMTMHRLLPASLYGWLGYRVFSFLFGWTDQRWNRALRSCFFQFSPVYVSAESMRWWVGRGGFASQGLFGTSPEHSWFGPDTPPMALWIAGGDALVDGHRLLEHFAQHEPHVRLVLAKVIPDYEHLDVLWARDAVDQVAQGVKQVILDHSQPQP